MGDFSLFFCDPIRDRIRDRIRDPIHDRVLYPVHYPVWSDPGFVDAVVLEFLINIKGNFCLLPYFYRGTSETYTSDLWTFS